MRLSSGVGPIDVRADPEIPAPVDTSRELTLSVVVPVYNEADVIAEFNKRLADVRAKLREISEVVSVNDGRKDNTLATLRLLREADPTIAIVNLSRNFGKEIALTAGLDHSKGDAVIIIDADLQDPPELISELDRAVARRSSRCRFCSAPLAGRRN